jgi:phospholipid transport system substrate-binding protein
MHHKLLATFALLLALLVPATASAGEATTLVQQKQNQLFTLVAQAKSEARQRKLAALFDEMLAYGRFVHESLGKKWDGLTPKQQERFTELLTKLVRGNYRRNLKQMLDYDVAYAGESASGGVVVVKTRAKHKTKKREPDIEIDFHLAKVDGALKVVDIVTERASLVKTYRSQFVRILDKDGFDKLEQKMQKKLEKLERESE